MAGKHTIFIGALFHVAIAMLEADSSTPRITLPESSLEPLPCTSQLPLAAARAWQHLGRHSIAKLGMDVSTCTLSPLLIPSMGRSCCFSLVLCSLLKAEMSECGCVLQCRAGLSKAPCTDSCLGYNTAPAWPSSSLKKLRPENT